MYKRSIRLDLHPKRSFFLWGARQTGKSTLLRQTYPDAFYIDLLNTEQFVKYQQSSARLRQELELLVSQQPKQPPFTIIDEIQKVPLLLDEIHWLIENRKLVFGLCGSSARKVRHGHANLLAGRADRFELYGLTFPEFSGDFSLERILNVGYLPGFYHLDRPERAIRSYCADYLKEEIAAEGLVRNLPSFTNFLEMAALGDTELLNYATIGRDCGVSPPTVKHYFELLEDTLMASFLPVYRKRPKRRTVASPKFYFFDVGIVNHLAKRSKIQIGSELFGKAFENWIHHEICAHRAYKELYYQFSYWRLSTGVEVDFILGPMDVAIEAKGCQRITSDHLKGLRELKKDYPKIKRRIVVNLEPSGRLTNDGIEILPFKRFCEELWQGGII